MRPPTPAVLAELDITVPGFFLRPDYFALLAWLRTNAPVFRLADGSWVVTRFDDIRTISRQPALFSSRQGALVNDPLRSSEPDDESGSLLHLDPPIHSDYRRLLNREFTPRAVALLEASVQATVNAAFDDVAGEQHIDLVDRIAAPIPVAVIADLLGIADHDRGQFRHWSDAVIEISDNPEDERVAVAAAELFTYLDAHVRAHLERPRDDLISMLVGASVCGKPLTHAQILMFCVTLLVAGNETTRTLLSGAALALVEHPDQRVALADDPSLSPGAVEECLRWVTPIQAFCRTTVAEVELGDTRLPAGAYVVMLYASGNRDETVFGPTAGDFDIFRPITPGHVAFGFGEHLCLGASLARLEAKLVITELLRRYPRYEITGEPVYVSSTLTRGMRSLPVQLRAP